MGTFVRRAVLALGALVVLAAVAGFAGVRASLPGRSGDLELPGLDAPVTIVFDPRARPFVRAGGVGDALFAQGFLHARERLFQMELIRRAGRGRLAEALGPGLLDTDRELWRSGVPQLAERIERNASRATRDRVGRYVAGVNAALERMAIRPPSLLMAGVPVRPWEPRDVYGVGAMTAFDSANNADNELLRLALAQALDDEAFTAFVPDEAGVPAFPYVIPPGSTLGLLSRRDALDAVRQPLLPSLSLGSNGWAVSGKRSHSGAALFAFDSHDALSLPNLLYEVHLFFGSEGQIRGFSVPGLPGVVNGFNGRIAWGFTNIGDSQDLYVETRDPADPTRFLGPDGFESARVERVEIPVRGRPEPERLEILHTRHGPLVSEDPPISMAWIGHRVEGLRIDPLFELNLARDRVEAFDALDRLAAPSANATYADVSGAIAVRTVGALPVRGRAEGLWPLPAHEPDVVWKGVLPARELPRSVDPESGFVAAANARVSPPGLGPLVSADNAPGYRMARIVDVLSSKPVHAPADMRALQGDWHNEQAARLLAVLLPELGAESMGPAERAAHHALERWLEDPISDPEQAAPLVFERFYVALARTLFAEHLGGPLFERLLRRNYVLNHALDGLLLDAATESPWWRGDRPARVREAFAAAVAGLRDEAGADPAGWNWGDHHRVTLRHELAKAVPLLGAWLDRGPFRWGGGHATVGRARYRYDRPEQVTGAATVRLVIEMTEPMQIWSIIPGGQSGHPADPHYGDQIADWLAGRHEAIPARFEDVSGRTLRLAPPEAG